MRQRLVGTGMIAAAVVALSLSGLAQAGRPFTTAFPKEEFAARRLKVAEAIGREAVALMQAAATVHSSAIFRQSNEFFYRHRRRRPAGDAAHRRRDEEDARSIFRSRTRRVQRSRARCCRRTIRPPRSRPPAIDEVKPAEQLQADWRRATRRAALDCSCRSSRPKAAPRAATVRRAGATTQPRIPGTAASRARRSCACC